MGDRKWSWCVSSEIVSAKHEGNKDDRIMSSKDRNKRALCETASPGWKAACEQARKKNALQSYFVNICTDLFF